MNKLSNAKQIKELYKEVLSDLDAHSRMELFEYAQRKSGGKYTDGMLTGALRTLVTDTDDYICVSRGWYRKKSGEEVAQEPDSLVDAYVEIFRDAIEKTQNITSDPFRIMRMNAEDMGKMREIEKCIQMISETIKKIQ